MKTDKWLSNLCKAVKTKHRPIQSAFSFKKQKYPQYISDEKNSEKNKKHTIISVSEFVIVLTLGFLWWKIKSLLTIFLMFHRTDFGGFLVCC